MPNSIYNIHNSLWVRYLIRLKIGFSQLKEHKLKHNLHDSINPMCSCSSSFETTIDWDVPDLLMDAMAVVLSEKNLYMNHMILGNWHETFRL